MPRHSRDTSRIRDRQDRARSDLRTRQCAARTVGYTIRRKKWRAAPFASNDEVERRGVAQSPNEADLSRSSISSLTQRRHGPRSLQLLGVMDKRCQSFSSSRTAHALYRRLTNGRVCPQNVAAHQSLVRSATVWRLRVRTHSDLELGHQRPAVLEELI
jgi:hypothetical protein